MKVLYLLILNFGVEELWNFFRKKKISIQIPENRIIAIPHYLEKD